MYDRSIKTLNEPHSPEWLDEMVSSGKINKGKFLNPKHSGSYQVQMEEIHALQLERVLEVGPGACYVADNLKRTGIQYDTLDFEGVHQPTIVADLREFDAQEYANKYELTCAFQVLEHFPFESFPTLLDKMATMSERYVFISLPYSCNGFSIDINLQKGQTKNKRKKIDFYWPTGLPNRKYRKEYMEEFPWAVHYWEIGLKGFSLKKVVRTIESLGLNVISKFHGPNPFHYFLLMEKTA